MASTEKILAECLEFAHKRLFKEKKTRTDVIDRKATNRDTTCTIVKTTWNSFCKPEARNLNMSECLLEVNKAITEAYILANLHVTRLCERQLQLPELGQTFFYQCLSAVSQGDRKRTEIKDMQFRQSVELYNSWKPAEYVMPQCAHLSSGLFQQASQQMMIAAKNSISMNFYRRFKRYLKTRYGLDKVQAYHMLKAIQADSYEGDDLLVLNYRRLMPNKPKYGQREDYPEVVMPLLYRFLKYYECCENQRLFTLLPMKQGFECSHVKVCSNGLQGLLKRSNITSIVHNDEPIPLPKATVEFRAMVDKTWRYLFNIDKFETANRRFAGEILTDGRAVSIVLRKAKTLEARNSPVQIQEYDEVWGLDPGRREIFVASNEAGELKRCSTAEYYDRCGFKACGNKIKMWYTDTDEDNIIKQIPCKKTCDLAKLQEYVQFLLPHLHKLLVFHMDKKFRSLKFRRYVLRQRTLRSMCQDLTSKAGKRTLVGFGDWSNKDSAGIIRKCPIGPVKKFQDCLKRYCTVVSVDEYKTSKTHETCHGELMKREIHKHHKKGTYKDQYYQGGEFKCIMKPHSVLFCANKSCRMLVNRDVNASRNILMCLKCSITGLERPSALSRVPSSFLGHCLSSGPRCQVAVPGELERGVTSPPLSIIT